MISTRGKCNGRPVLETQLEGGQYTAFISSDRTGPKVSGAINRAVKELLNKKLIEYTLPEKPNSRLQKYRLTEKGRQLVTKT